MRETRLGLFLNRIGLRLILAWVAMTILQVLLSSPIPGLSAIFWIGPLLFVAGQMLCLYAPAGRPLVLAAVLSYPLMVWAAEPFNIVLAMLALLLFVLFIRRLSLWLKRPDLARQAVLLLGALFCLLLVWRLLCFLLAVPAEQVLTFLLFLVTAGGLGSVPDAAGDRFSSLSPDMVGLIWLLLLVFATVLLACPITYSGLLARVRRALEESGTPFNQEGSS